MNEILDKYKVFRERGDEIKQSFILSIIDELLVQMGDWKSMSHSNFIHVGDLEKEVTALRQEHELVKAGIVRNIKDKLVRALPDDEKPCQHTNVTPRFRFDPIETKRASIRGIDECNDCGEPLYVKDDYPDYPCKCHCHNMKKHSDARCRCVKNCIHCHPENFVKPPNDFKRIGESNEEADRRMAVVKYKDELKAKIERMRPRIYIDEDLNRIHQECLDGVLKLIEEEA